MKDLLLEFYRVTRGRKPEVRSHSALHLYAAGEPVDQPVELRMCAQLARTPSPTTVLMGWCAGSSTIPSSPSTPTPHPICTCHPISRPTLPSAPGCST